MDSNIALAEAALGPGSPIPATSSRITSVRELCSTLVMEPLTLFAELKRRNVYKVAIAYAVVAWLLIQITTQVFPFFNIPHWTIRMVIVLLALGLPVALVLSWVYELTPEGVKRTEEVAPHQSITRTTGRKLDFLIMAVLLGAIALLVTDRFRPRATAVGDPREKSVAVLPFENLSSDRENVFFAGGVQDDILTNLARIADLKVISRTSVMNYKVGPERNVREIAKSLGVTHVVEGSVQRADGRVRVNAQLIDARTDAHLWAERYDRELADVFAIQSEIAEKISDQLRARLSPAEKAAIARRPTADLGAYDLYLEARQLLNTAMGSKDAAGTIKKAVALLDEATQRDPAFALAYCLLARAHENLYWDEMDRSPARLALAKRALDAARQLNPDLGETHLAQARYQYVAFRDYDSARRELELARRALPNDSDVLILAGLIDRRQNRWAEALRDLQKASELDPRNGEIIRATADTYFELRQYAEMEKLLKRALVTIPEHALVFYAKLADCQLARGDPKSVVAMFDKAPPSAGVSGFGTYYRFTAALYLREYEAANHFIAAGPAKIPDSFKGPFCPHAWFEALVAMAQNDSARAQTSFAAARDIVETAWGRSPDDPARLSLMARIDAGLERNEDAVRKAKEAVALRPIATDALDGPMLVTSLALVYAWTGERDLAVEQLAIVAKVPAGPTYGDLQLNPRWDSLRGDPRFESIVASLAPIPVE